MPENTQTHAFAALFIRANQTNLETTHMSTNRIHN